MRTEHEMMDLILNVASRDERVRVVAMNGSRTNPNVQPDAFQDYDIVYIVTEMKSFLQEPLWIDVFGERIILQTPESMSLFPPELGNWFSYLMLFEDGNRIDLLLVPLEELDQYIRKDKLIRILLDKDKRVPPLPPPADMDYWVKQPEPVIFDECCNEFWWLAPYVAKGLCRDELPYAIDHLNMMRSLLYMMLSWEAGADTGYSVSMGKNYKYLKNYLPQATWDTVMKTYGNATGSDVRDSLWLCCGLFRTSAGRVAALLRVPYPEYDSKVTPYLTHLLTIPK